MTTYWGERLISLKNKCYFFYFLDCKNVVIFFIVDIVREMHFS